MVCAEPELGEPWRLGSRYSPDGQVTPKVDVFSFGVLAWYMYTGEHPWGRDVKQVPPRAGLAMPCVPSDTGVLCAVFRRAASLRA